MLVSKAVFPVAGLGTRFLPATKVIPKEMLPVVDKPIIQYATDEAINAGITDLIFVVSETKMSIRDHYAEASILNEELREKQKYELLEMVNSIIPSHVSCTYVDQPRALGLGHAVLCAREAVGKESFAVILPDDMIDDDAAGCLEQMTRVYNDNKRSIVAIEDIDPAETDKYGIVSTEKVGSSLYKMQDIVEKPAPANAPSSLAVVGRYILTHAIFDYLDGLGKGAGGEIQLTDAIKQLLATEDVYAYEFYGKRFDCGSKQGYIKANLNYALKHPEVRDGFREYLAGL